MFPLILVALLAPAMGIKWWEPSECYLDPAYEARIKKDLQQFRDGITPSMIQQAKALNDQHVRGPTAAVCTVSIKDHQLDPQNSDCMPWKQSKEAIGYALEDIAKDLPDLEFVINFIDIPKIFKNECEKTTEKQSYGCFCDKNFTIGRHAFFYINWFKNYQKLPIFSGATIPQCVRDILMPAHHFFYNSIYQYVEKETVPWDQRQFKAFWRGAISDYHPQKVEEDFTAISHRMNFVNYAKNFPEVDAAFYGFYEKRPDLLEKFQKNFPIGKYLDYYQIQKFKILIDIDGASFSQRFPKYLRSGAAIFKIAEFDDIGVLAVRPWEHYVPVKMDLSDFKQKLEWAKENDEELQRIARRGKKRSEEVHTFQIYKCYMKRLLLQYHKLVEKGKRINSRRLSTLQ